MVSSKSALSPLEIRTGEGQYISILSGISRNTHNDVNLAGFNSMHAHGDFGAMDFHHFAGQGFSIWFSEYQVIRPVEFLSTGNFSVLELSIPMEANIYSSWDHSENIFIESEQFELSYVPFINHRTEFRYAGRCKTFDIHYSRDYLDRFSGTYPELGLFLERIDRGEAATLTGRSRFISPAMKRIVMDILAYNMSGNLARYFYEASVLLMLTLVLDRIGGQKEKKTVRYSDYEKETVLEARNLMVADFSEKYTISELARKTGTSDTKLQLAFKHFYGTTIFEYAQNARLDHAKMLLLDTDQTIQSIAEFCGYPDNSNLTAAFRKKFGYTPESYRAKGK